MATYLYNTVRRLLWSTAEANNSDAELPQPSLRLSCTHAGPEHPPLRLESDRGGSKDISLTENTSQAAVIPMQACPACDVERRAYRTYRWKLIVGMMLPFALQALDATM
jgi:hypothetical protein